MRHRLPQPAGLSTWLVVVSALLFGLGAGFATAAVLGCTPFEGRCPTAWVQSLHPLLRGVRLATVAAVAVGLAFFGLSGAMAMRRRR